MEESSSMASKKVVPNEQQLIEEEIRQIKRRRQLAGFNDEPIPAGATKPTEPQQELAEQQPVGLAFSGGGIRSATFNLGLLQGLAKLGLLPYVDYLSTVSGGGYLGGWFTSWVQRAQSLDQVAQQLLPAPADRAAPPPAEEPAEIQHLRRYSNYLAPRVGFLTADTWVLYAIYLRNFLLCQAVLLPITAMVLVVARMALILHHPDFVLEDRLGTKTRYWDYGFALVILVLWVVAALIMFRGACGVREEGDPPPSDVRRETWLPLFLFGAVSLLMLAAIFFCYYPASEVQRLKPIAELNSSFGIDTFLAYHLGWDLSDVQLCLLYCLIPGVLLFLVCAVAYAVYGVKVRVWIALAQCVWVGLAGSLGGLLLYGAFRLLTAFYAPGPEDLLDVANARGAVSVTTFGPPLVLGVFTLTIFLAVGLLNFHLGEGVREWWSSLCARLLLAGGLWLAVTLVAFYATPALLWAGPWVKLLLGSGWLLTVLGGIVTGSSALTDAQERGSGPADWLARLAPPAFLVGLLVVISVGLHQLLDHPPQWQATLEQIDWPIIKEPPWPRTRSTTVTTRTDPAADPAKAAKDAPRMQQEQKTVVEQARQLNDAELALQLYWLGMFNTMDGFVPRPCIDLRPQDLWTLRAAGVPDSVRQELRKIATTDRHLRECMCEETTEAAMEAKLKPASDVLDKENLSPVEMKFYKDLIRRTTHDGLLIHFRHEETLKTLGLVLAILAAVGALAAWRVDVNRFSLHGLYGNRLVRCYLGATRQPNDPRHPDPFTGFDPDDELKLACLKIPRPDAAGSQGAPGYQGPLLIINTALNLVHGKELAWQERKAESFVLTPSYCGSPSTGYHPTETFHGGPGGLGLGTAVTISGAAASPNSGYHSSPAVTALLTVFNARLGAWLRNPHYLREHPLQRGKESQDSPGFDHLFFELFGLTDDRSRYVYLSDGGHFENLGVYELVRRRCRYIIASDAGQDRAHAFEDLGNLLRKCRTDFGIRIDIDLGSLRRAAEGGRTRWHCAIGKIHYEDVDPDALPGTLVYIKPSLTGDEPTDILDYQARNPDFPHETTADQFFSESQFESYRALGLHIAQGVFAESRDDMLDELAEHDGGRRGACRSLFSSLVRRWFAMPPEYEQSFLNSTEGYMEMQASMASDDRMRRLTAELYPELGLAPAVPVPAEVARDSAEMHTLLRMLQVFENAWLSLDLDRQYAHPLNRGWMDVFYRWATMPTFRRLWPLLRGEFGRGFVRFCERQMGIGNVKILLEPVAGGELPARLVREFEEEWQPREEKLEDWHRRCVRVGEAPLCWRIETRMPGEDFRACCGVVMVCDDPKKEPSSYELFIWMRGAYRNSGVGRRALRRVIKDLRDKYFPRRKFCLRVLLPKAKLTGPGGKLLEGMWLTFFQHEDFRRVPDQPSAAPPTSAAEAKEARAAKIELARVIEPASGAEVPRLA